MLFLEKKFKDSLIFLMKYFKILFVLWFFFIDYALAQDSSRVEWIKVNFNMPGDKSVAFLGNEASDRKNLVHTLVALIDSAKFSVDLCVYDIEHPDLVHALVRAKNRGLRVRVVTDDGNRTDGRELDEYFIGELVKAGIYSIDDDGDVYLPDGSISDTKKVNSGTDMHHKFTVIDYLSADKNDDLVWAGSTNMTWTGNFNTNVTIIIKDSGVAQAYLNEFEQMWGGSGDKPNQEKARFHKDKTLHSGYVYWVGKTKVEVYFSPWDREQKKKLISERIAEVVKEQTQSDVKFSAFSITPGITVSNTLWEIADKPNVKLDGVISSDFYSRYEKKGQIWASEASRTGNRLILKSNELRKLHHKTILIDAENTDSSDVAVTITGSYNFSTNADRSNDENLIIIYSDEITNQFLQDFYGIQNRAKGKWNIPIPEFYKDSLYSVAKISDADKLELQVVPGFGFPVQLAGIRAPWIWRGKDSTTYYAEKSSKYVNSNLKGKSIRIEELWVDSAKAKIEVILSVPELGISDWSAQLLQKGLVGVGYSKNLNKSQWVAYKKMEEEAQKNFVGMWEFPEKAWKVIPIKKKADLDDLLANPINLNESDLDEITQLPGIGPSKAQAIIDYRMINGPFESVEDLVKVKGFGAKTLQKLLPYLTVEPNSENKDE